MSLVVPWVSRFRNVANLISGMVIGYGELEFELACCLIPVVGSADSAINALFRLRSESQRLDVADAILRPTYNRLNLHDAYSQTLGALRTCKALRNQYAHCHWTEQSGKLHFFNLEQHAKKEGISGIKVIPVDASLVAEQAEFFDYCFKCILYLRSEHLRLLGEIPAHDWKRPKAMRPPKLLPS